MSQATQKKYDVLVIGAGAAGLMCAIEAGKRGRKVWLIDHSAKTAEKIRISGGGRANFTNVDTRPEAFLSQNKHFCKSALSQYTQHDFIALVEKHEIAYHEKTLGQLFCDDSAQQIIDMLLDECADAGVKIDMSTAVEHIGHKDGVYSVQTTQGAVDVDSVVVATGGLSIPKIGATKFGYTVAEQFGLNMIAPCAGLVPLTFTSEILDLCKNISGLSVAANVKCGKTNFAEGLLFTHRGLSGPSILQISSYWEGGQTIEINLAPSVDVDAFLKEKQITNPKQDICNSLSEIIPKRLAESICVRCDLSGNVAEVSNKSIALLKQNINTWTIKPNGTEGYRTAEVTTGGVDTNALSSKTMEVKSQPGLFFIGEVVDVTGHLGGYNFQWAWSSGYVAGQYA